MIIIRVLSEMVKNKQKPSVKLKVIPYMALRARVLEMNLLELNEFVNQLIVSNPFIEEARYAPETIQPNDFEKYIAKSEDMYENLLHQFRMLVLDETTERVGEFIIKGLNEDGYFVMPLGSVSKQLNVSVKDVEKALKIVQTLDPPGIGARNLSECLLLQLKSEQKVSPKIKHVILNHLKDLADGNYSTISKETGLKINTLKSLREKILHFTVSPSLAFEENKIRRIIVPDLYIAQTENGFEAHLNEKFARKFFINDDYLKIIKSNSRDKNREFVKMAEQAKWTLQSYLERRKMLLEIGNFIADKEEKFLSGIASYPLKHTANEIAHFLGTDESSVSRLVQNKYIETPVGVFPLRYFLQHKSKPYNDEELKLKIKELIKNEDKSHPLTDEQIAEVLSKNGLKIKRRTVVKYRKLLKLPSSSKRRLTNH